MDGQTAIKVAIITGIFALCGTIITVFGTPLASLLFATPTPTIIATTIPPNIEVTPTPVVVSATEIPPTPTAFQPQPTFPPIPSLTPYPTEIPTPAQQVWIYETFDSNVNNWSTCTKPSDNGSATCEIKDGKYQIIAKSKAASIPFYLEAPKVPATQDFILKFDVTIHDYTGNSKDGQPVIRITFRADRGIGYDLRMHDNRFMLGLNQNNETKIIYNWDSSNVFNLAKGSTTSFMLDVKGNTLNLSANGLPVAIINTLENLPYGGITMGFYFYQADQEIRADFDNVIVQSNP